VVEQLEVDDFFFESHRLIYRAMRTVLERGDRVDAKTITDELAEASALTPAGGPAVLAQLEEAGTIAAYVPEYVAIVKRHAIRRRGIQVLMHKIGELYGPDGRGPARPLGEVLGDGADALNKLLEQAEPESRRDNPARVPSFVSMREVLEATALNLRFDVPDLVPFPMEALNRRFGGGFKPGELVIIGGMTGSAKSALMGWCARHAANQGHVTGIISVEMTNEDLGQRVLADAAQVSATALRSQNLDALEWARIDRIIPTFTGVPYYLCDEAIHVLQVGRMLRRAAPKIRLLFVDYMQLLDAPRAPARYQEVGLVGKLLKRYAKKYDCTVVGISSVTPPEPTGRGKKSQRQAPSMRHLRESRDLEYHADVILMLWQPDPQKSEREVIIEKGRNGAAEGYRVRLEFTPMYQRFQEI
jgi:replicative DNA helicase